MARADPFGPLIRLRRFRLDEERRALSEALLRLDHLQHELLTIAAEREREQAQSGDLTTEAGWAFPAYARRSMERQRRQQQQADEAERAAAEQRTRVLERWRELRTLELADEARRRGAADEAAREERLRLDETAANAWRRRQEGEAEEPSNRRDSPSGQHLVPADRQTTMPAPSGPSAAGGSSRSSDGR